MRRVLLAGTISAVALAAQAQPPRGQPTQPSVPTVITGRVVADASGDGLPNARVTVRSNALGAPVVLTDAEGRFRLTAAQDRVIVAVSKSGYGPRELQVTRRSGIEIRLSRGAAISGHVVDEFGDPVVNARVTAETPSTTTDTSTIVASTLTDDRGEYRLASLPSGSFAVALTVQGGPVVERLGANQFVARPSVSKVFFPDAAAARNASQIRLQPGDDQSGFNFVIPARQPAPRSMMAAIRQFTNAADGRTEPPETAEGVVRGRVVANDGRVIPRADVRLIPQGDIAREKVAR